MILTITTSYRPATDLGFLLHKNPARPQVVEVATGLAHVFYPEADEDRCTAALVLEVDPIALVRGHKGPASEGFALGQYVHDRPYAASSMLAVALGKAFASARRGVSKERPELAESALPLEIHIPALSCRGGAAMVERFFRPLGWEVRATPVVLDEEFPQWGDSRYVDLHLSGMYRVADAINHLYVALPVLDDAKHYWVSTDEIDKLLRAGAGWLSGHPDRELITRRYLAHRTAFTREAMARLAEVDDLDPAAADPDGLDSDDATDVVMPLVQHRHGAVLAALRSAGARRVIDLGCGSGALLPALLAEPAFTDIVGVDVSSRALEIAAKRLRLDRLPEHQRRRISLLQGALTYTDDRLKGYDAAVLMEVIEHLDLDRMPALGRTVFGHSRPGTVVVTTPNADYNVRYEALVAGNMRHRDHRFEWSRAQFGAWADGICSRYGYAVRFLPVGPADPDLGSSTQMAVFSREVAS